MYQLTTLTKQIQLYARIEGPNIRQKLSWKIKNLMWFQFETRGGKYLVWSVGNEMKIIEHIGVFNNFRIMAERLEKNLLLQNPIHLGVSVNK